MLSLSPVAYWPMGDQSGLPIDVSGNGNDMTAVNGTPTYGVQGPFNNPSIDYPSGAYHERAVVSTKTNDFMYVFWIRRDGAPTSAADIFTGGTTSGGLTVEWNGTGGNTRGNIPGVGTLGNIGVVPDVTWTMMGAGKASGTSGAVSGIFNGALVSLGTANTGTPTGNNRITCTVANGQRISHFAYFDRVLTALEIATMYQIGQKVVIPL